MGRTRDSNKKDSTTVKGSGKDPRPEKRSKPRQKNDLPTPAVEERNKLVAAGSEGKKTSKSIAKTSETTRIIPEPESPKLPPSIESTGLPSQPNGKSTKAKGSSHVEKGASGKRKRPLMEHDMERLSSTSKRQKTEPPLRNGNQTNMSHQVESDSDDDTEGQNSQEVYLHGFSGDEDSSDDDSSVDGDTINVKSLPTLAKTAIVQQKLERAKKQKTDDKGVLYIGRVPHGFYEEQMKDYFSQFGNVTRLRLARNKKTGRSKHYAFIEFDSSSVAKIVSETMDNYLIAGHLLQCKMVPADKVHPDLWIGSNKKWRLIPKGRLARLAHNKDRTNTQKRRAEQRLLKRQEEKMAKLKAAGMEYSLDKVGYKA